GAARAGARQDGERAGGAQAAGRLPREPERQRGHRRVREAEVEKKGTGYILLRRKPWSFHGLAALPRVQGPISLETPRRKKQPVPFFRPCRPCRSSWSLLPGRR